MKRSLFLGCLLVCSNVAVAVALPDDSGKISVSAPEHVEAVKKATLSSSGAIGYAYMQGGTKLLKVSMLNNGHDKDVELIRITAFGFYPDYSMTNKEEKADDAINCVISTGMGNDAKGNKKLFCDSHYTSREVLSTIASSTLTAGLAALTFGTTLLVGLPDPKYFHQKDFLEIVENNELPKHQANLLELVKYANQRSQEMDALYAKALTDYQGNKNLISLSYSVTDKSGLLQNKELDGGYTVALNAPAKKSYSYTSLINGEAFTKEDAVSKTATLKERIEQQYQKDLKEYKTYLATAFKNYNIVGQSEKKFAHNSNISFDATIKAPTEVPYTLGKKINITIPITVETASLNNMVPKAYTIDDSNFIAVMGVNSNLSVNGVLSNKTQSFITVKSLTCYYQSLVNNISNLDKELAPDSRALDDGTRYALLSSTMKEKVNFTQMTKSKADSIKINYGYAVKYKVNDTNIEKAIYTTKNYSLYDIYRQYL